MKDYRKWSIAVLSLGLAFVLALISKLTGEFATVVSVTVTATAGANAVEHYSRGRNGTPTD